MNVDSNILNLKSIIDSELSNNIFLYDIGGTYFLIGISMMLIIMYVFLGLILILFTDTFNNLEEKYNKNNINDLELILLNILSILNHLFIYKKLLIPIFSIILIMLTYGLYNNSNEAIKKNNIYKNNIDSYLYNEFKKVNNNLDKYIKYEVVNFAPKSDNEFIIVYNKNGKVKSEIVDNINYIKKDNVSCVNCIGFITLLDLNDESNFKDIVNDLSKIDDEEFKKQFNNVLNGYSKVIVKNVNIYNVIE